MTNRSGRNDRSSINGDSGELDAELAGFAPERTNLLPALHLLQHRLGYLPAWAMERVGHQLHIPASEVHGVASAYTEFRFAPPPEGLIQICTGLSCRLAGAGSLLEEGGRRRPDAVETIPCVFLCALAPVIVSDGELVGHVDSAKLEQAQRVGIGQRQQSRAH
jgi:NADH:ubiquinone oxidoreductase subunit E